MPVEVATYLNDLVEANPPSSDQLKQADDHMRLIKAVLKASFPGVTAPRYLEQAREDVADSATPAVWAATSNNLNLLGATTITGFASGTAGQFKIVRFAASRTLTHNATTLELPGGANIVTDIGDHALILCGGGTSNKVIGYFRLNGKPIADVFPVPQPLAADATKALVASGAGAYAWSHVVPAGAIVAWPHLTPPTGWLECDGTAVSRTTYAALFALIADDYGPGNGTTTFNLPDYRGEFLRGMDPGSSRDPDSASRTDRGDGTTGANVGTKQGHALQSHTHTYDQPINANSPTGSGATRIEAISAGTATGGPTGSVSTETRPRNVNVKWIIKAH